MVEVRKSTIVDAPLEDVWAILRDFNGHDSWHPAIAQSEIEDGVSADRIGAVRDFRLASGGRIREQLLALSDHDHQYTYCIISAPLALQNYVATVKLTPVTDGNQTLWQWQSRFNTPKSQGEELSRIVGEDIYEAGFRAIKQNLRGLPKPRAMPHSPPLAIPLAGTSSPAQAIVLTSHGGPEVLQLRDVSVPPPQAAELRIRQRFVGVNYIDVYTRTGYFNLVAPPGIPGMEAMGIVESLGAGVGNFRVGDRVAYACAPPGAYVSLRNMPAENCVLLPDFIGDELAAAGLLKGITSSFLLHEVYAVKPGDVVLIHAAAGGVGQLLCQWAKALGAIVIGTCSTPEKLARAKASGCDYVINYTAEDFAATVLELTQGKGADAIYDAVGRDTFESSLRALKIRGTLVSFGQASGDIGAYELGKLAHKSVTLCRPNYGHFTSTQDDISRHANRLFEILKSGQLRIDRPTIFPLGEAAAAHRALESRSTIGAIILAT
jgi:NADPH:quinone reductase